MLLLSGRLRRVRKVLLSGRWLLIVKGRKKKNLSCESVMKMSN